MRLYCHTLAAFERLALRTGNASHRTHRTVFKRVATGASQRVRAALIGLVLLPCAVLAQQSERFGPYELYYSVVNTTFLEPKVAASYGITRGRKRAFVNLSLRERTEGAGTAARTMVLRAHARDLMQRQRQLEFREIREGDAIYYIAEFPFANEEWLLFEIEFTPEGAGETYTYSFKHQLFVD